MTAPLTRTLSLVLTLCTTAALAAAPDAITLAKGAQRVISVPGLERVAVGDPSVCDVKTLGKGELLVVGLAPGTTTIVAWSKGVQHSWVITVTPMPNTAVAAPGAEAVTVAVGAQRVLVVPGLQRVALGDPEVCDVKALGGGELLLIGQKPGSTTLLAWTKTARQEFALTITPMAKTAADATPGVPSSELHLAVGQSKTLTFAGLNRASVGDPSVVDVVEVKGGALTLKALAAGVTTLLTWTPSGRNSPLTIVVEGPVAAPRDVTPAASEVITLSVGQTLKRAFPGLGRVAVGDPAVVDIAPGPDSTLALKGLAAGRTTMLVWPAGKTANEDQRTAWTIVVTAK